MLFVPHEHIRIAIRKRVKTECSQLTRPSLQQASVPPRALGLTIILLHGDLALIMLQERGIVLTLCPGGDNADCTGGEKSIRSQ